MKAPTEVGARGYSPRSMSQKITLRPAYASSLSHPPSWERSLIRRLSVMRSPFVERGRLQVTDLSAPPKLSVARAGSCEPARACGRFRAVRRLPVVRPGNLPSQASHPASAKIRPQSLARLGSLHCRD